MVNTWFDFTALLNGWAASGVFSYVIPFLLLFAVVFAVLNKSKILGENVAIEAIVAAAIGLLALQFDIVSNFFAVMFPRFGVGLAIFLGLILLFGLFFQKKDGSGSLKWISIVVAVGVCLWVGIDYGFFSNLDSLGFNSVDGLSQFFWPLLIIGIFFLVIYSASKSRKKREDDKRRASGG